MFKKYLVPVLSMVALSFLVWHPILNQTFLGEGYYYFDSVQSFINQIGTPNFLSNYWSSYDNLARLIFDLLPIFFKDNLILYQGFAIFAFGALVSTIFLTVRFITKNVWVAISSSVLFLASYSGVFELLAAGNYQRFAQRIPNFIFMFVSFLLLSKYLDGKKIKHLVLSLIIFAVTVFMAHYSTFLLPFFVIYLLVAAFFEKDKKKGFIKNASVALIFVAINYLIISYDYYTPKSDFIGLLTEKSNLMQMILLQLTSLTYPPTMLNQIAQIAQPYTRTAVILSFPVITILTLGILLIKKREPKYLKLYLTCFLTVPAILFLNIVIGRIDAVSVIRGDRYYFIPFDAFQQLNFSPYGGSRYYFLPIALISILWSLIIWAIFKNKKTIYKLVTVSLLIFYVVYNAKLIRSEIRAIQPVHERMKVYLSYIKENSGRFSKKTIVVTPPDFIWASHIVRAFYGFQEMRFIPLKEGWEKQVPMDDKGNVVIFGFDYKTNTVIEK